MMQRISIIAALLLLSCSVHAQITLVVKGKITDNKNNPVANASINQLGTANATVSNNKGFYAIEVEYEDSCVIEFSSIEYAKRTLVIYASNKATIYKDIVLMTNENVIDTVEITATKTKVGESVLEAKDAEYFY